MLRTIEGCWRGCRWVGAQGGRRRSRYHLKVGPAAGCRRRRAPLQDGSVRLSQQSTHILVDAGDDGPLGVIAWDEVAVAAGPEFVWMNPSSVGVIMLLILVGRIAIAIAVVSRSSDRSGHCGHMAWLGLAWLGSEISVIAVLSYQITRSASFGLCRYLGTSAAFRPCRQCNAIICTQLKVEQVFYLLGDTDGLIIKGQQ